MQSKRGTGARIGYIYLHSAVDGFSRLAYAEALEDERATTTIGFFCRARAFFAAHGIERIHRVVSDNGAHYRAKDFTRTVGALASRHQRIRPYPPRHNGKVGRFNRLLADEGLCPRPYASEQARRNAIRVGVNHFNHHRPHTACGNPPPPSRVPARINTVMPSYIQIRAALPDYWSFVEAARWRISVEFPDADLTANRLFLPHPGILHHGLRFRIQHPRREHVGELPAAARPLGNRAALSP